LHNGSGWLSGVAIQRWTSACAYCGAIAYPVALALVFRASIMPRAVPSSAMRVRPNPGV